MTEIEKNNPEGLLEAVATEDKEEKKKNSCNGREEKIKEGQKRIGEKIFELWTDEHGNPYATIINKKHNENWAIYSRRFKNFITRVFYEELEEVPNSQQLKTFQDVFAAMAQFDGGEYDTYLRCAKLDDSLYIDLCRDDWSVLKITKDKIEEGESDIKFKRFNHMKELKYDLEASESDLDLIFKYVNIENEKDKLLFKIDCVLQAIANIPRVIDNSHGSPGSGKTFAFDCKRKLIDPSSMGTLSLSKDKTELIQKLSHHYICYFDNVRRISQEYSDIFCRTTTGDAFSKRELYTDDEDIIYKLKRKLGFNGINVVGEEPDFLDRSITYELLRIPKKERKKEGDMLKEFEQDQPKITGAIFKILQKTLSKVEDIEMEELPRMADYCFWGEAVAQVIGEKEKVFTIAYFEKIGNLSKEALETNPVGLSLLEFMSLNNSFEGTASELLEKLTEIADSLKIDTKRYFPKAPNALTRRINEIKANLEEEGLKVEYDKTGKQRLIRIYPKKSVETDESSLKDKSGLEKPKSSEIKTDDTSDGIEGKEKNMVETSTIDTIKYDTSKNKDVGESPTENVGKNNDFNDIDNTSIKETKIDFSKLDEVFKDG